MDNFLEKRMLNEQIQNNSERLWRICVCVCVFLLLDHIEFQNARNSCKVRTVLGNTDTLAGPHNIQGMFLRLNAQF